MPLPRPSARHVPPQASFQARHLSHAYVQHLTAPPIEVMSFLTPTGERAWAEDWDPTVLHPESGPEGEGTAFATPDAWWICTEFSAPEGGRPARITYAHFTPDRDVTTIHITLEPEGRNGTLARVRYAWTGLSPEGNAFVAQRTSARFEQGMKAWETALNAVLKRRP